MVGTRYFEKKLPGFGILVNLLVIKTLLQGIFSVMNKSLLQYFYTFTVMSKPFLQPYYHIVVIHSNVDVNRISSNFQVFSGPQRLHCLKSGQNGPQ